MEKSQQDCTQDDRWMGCIFNRAHYISGNIFLKGKWLQSFYSCLLCCYQLLSEKGQDNARWMLDLNNLWPITLQCVVLKCLVKPATLSLQFLSFSFALCVLLKISYRSYIFLTARVAHKIQNKMLFALKDSQNPVFKCYGKLQFLF